MAGGSATRYRNDITSGAALRTGFAGMTSVSIIIIIVVVVAFRGVNACDGRHRCGCGSFGRKVLCECYFRLVSYVGRGIV